MKPNLLGRLSVNLRELFMVPQPASRSRELASAQIGISSEILRVTSLRQRGRRRMDWTQIFLSVCSATVQGGCGFSSDESIHVLPHLFALALDALEQPLHFPI